MLRKESSILRAEVAEYLRFRLVLKRLFTETLKTFKDVQAYSLFFIVLKSFRLKKIPYHIFPSPSPLPTTDSTGTFTPIIEDERLLVEEVLKNPPCLLVFGQDFNSKACIVNQLFDQTLIDADVTTEVCSFLFK